MSSKPVIDFASGFPATSLLPADRLKEAATSVLSNQIVWQPGLIYGPDEGFFPLRENISSWLTRYYKPANPISADRICITGGASQNLANILQVFTDPVKTRKIWVIEPAYFLAFRIFEDAGFNGKMHGVIEDAEGVDIAFLEKALEAEREEYRASGSFQTSVKCDQQIKASCDYRKLYSHIIYCVPTFSNPSGAIMSRPRREALLRLARTYDALIISDDVYDFLNWSSDPEIETQSQSTTAILRIVDLDRTLDGGPRDGFGNAVSNGSFSKILGPGCRVGWAEGTEKFIYGLCQSGSTRSGGAPSQLMSTFVNDLMMSGSLEDHMASTIQAYRRRYFTMFSAIETQLLPLGVSFNPSLVSSATAGGIFFWLKLPSPLTAKHVADYARREENIIFGIGPSFSLPEGNVRFDEFEDMIRLCFSYAEEASLIYGVAQLARIVRKLLEEQ
ncbi:hypothetical protein N7462_003974 [Penicillium macrosclerotiorum]|uniref:uncharacterized protein n=1 Tax=Penicillium macrosclerotiorum TaxID=303699 RepID=UPI00254736BA|nr:uncharacterized protein N7462_003974 [Penicillium macrosclerotiorum]KAJ5689582.1 hypothetical protein N7462_003974 [Penicillium macrosclerotiorum]